MDYYRQISVIQTISRNLVSLYSDLLTHGIHDRETFLYLVEIYVGKEGITPSRIKSFLPQIKYLYYMDNIIKLLAKSRMSFEYLPPITSRDYIYEYKTFLVYRILGYKTQRLRFSIGELELQDIFDIKQIACNYYMNLIKICSYAGYTKYNDDKILTKHMRNVFSYLQNNRKNIFSESRREKLQKRQIQLRNLYFEISTQQH
jgi:hypothetical protein